MEMKKAASVILFAIASISTIMAHGGHDEHKAPAAAPASAPAPSPTLKGGAAALYPFLGVSLLSFVAYYLQF
ncbi:hypothetical protein RJT34_27620 [Clitoria ternatea]|uniref:Arabinogalactan peptide 23-like n=1 Tax=Clitoria ternatea TaxID=43366 RepID=A0AAN9FD36_CLITE